MSNTDNNERMLRDYLADFRESENRARKVIRRSLVLPFGAGLLWLGASLYQANRVRKEVRELEDRKTMLVAEATRSKQEVEDARQELLQRSEELNDLKRRIGDATKDLEVASPRNAAAIEQFQQLLTPKEKPDKPTAQQLWSRGYQAYLAGNRGEARKYYQLVLAQYPNYAPAINSLGRLAGDDGNSAEEERLYREALQANDGYVPALNNLARVEYEKGRLDEAENLSKKALSLRKGYPPAVELLRQIQADRKK